MLEFDRQFTDIRFLSGFSDNQIVAQLLPGAKKFPAYDRFAVCRETDSIACNFFLKDVQVARLKAVGPRFK
jgi:hypothetical protein